jgi:uncharacterized protein
MLAYNKPMDRKIEKLIPIFEEFPQVKLVYFFGSRATGEEGPMSDYDFAAYLDEKDKKKICDIRFLLMDKLAIALKAEKVDVVIINTAEKPDLKYGIIKEGKLIFEREPYRVLIEPRILREYFDFHQMMVRHSLTNAK